LIIFQMIKDLYPTMKGYERTTGLNYNTKRAISLKDDVYTIIEEVFKYCDQISKHIDEADELRLAYKQTVEKKIEDETHIELTAMNSKINKLFFDCNGRIDKLRREVNDEMKGDPDCNDPYLRMKNLISKALQAKVYALIKLSQKNQLEVKITVQDKIARQLAIYDPSLSPEQVQTLIKDPNRVDQIVKEKMYSGTNPKIQAAINSIKEKLEEINELEKNVMFLFKMIQDLALIIKAQTELVTSIEANIRSVKDFIASGIANFEKAKENYMKAQEKFCMILVVCLIIGIFGVGYAMSQLGLF